MTTKISVYRWLYHMALLRCMGPRLRGDDSRESLPPIVESGNPGGHLPGHLPDAMGPYFRGDERN
jgi:hypothetical protein